MGSPPVYFLEQPILLPAAASRKMIDRCLELFRSRPRDHSLGGKSDRTATPAIICGELGGIVGDVQACRRYRCGVDWNRFWNKTFRSRHKQRLRLNNLKKMMAALMPQGDGDDFDLE
jgi:hypothetical protein